MLRPRQILEVGNSGLLLLVFLTIFIVPMLPLAWHKLAFQSLFTLILLTSVLALQTQRNSVFITAATLSVINWISTILGMEMLDRISTFLTLLFFILIVIKLIIQIASIKKVTTQVILEAINSYLLLGMVFASITGLIMTVSRYSFSFKGEIHFDPAVSHFSEYLYFAFVTMTTLGYGDIVPQTAVAKSIAMLTAVSGQIYIAVLLSFLVGKYVSEPQ